MKTQLTRRIKMERIGKRLEFEIQANRTSSTIILVPIIFIICLIVIGNFIDQKSAEAPFWWTLGMVSLIPLIGALFLRQWLWEQRGQESLSFDLLTETLTYRKSGSYWLGEDQVWPLSSLTNLHVKTRGLLEGNLKFVLPPFSTLKGQSAGNSFQFGDTLKIEEGFMIWLIARREGFIKDLQFKEGVTLPELEHVLTEK